jgi:putative hydrolase of the HAD superfamily
LIQAVFFDLDDTLLWDERSVEEAFDVTCATAAARVGVDPSQLLQAVRTEARALYSTYPTFPFTQMIGINPFEGLWAHFTGGQLDEFRQLQAIAPEYRRLAWTRGLAVIGIDQPELGAELAEQFGAERRARPIVYADTFRILDELKQKYRLLLLTNGTPDLQWEKIHGVDGLEAYFEQIVISGEYGRGKPDTGIFEHALSRMNLQPEQAIMVGDKLTTDILGGNRSGIPTVWINRHDVTRTDEIVPKHEIRSLSELPGLITQLNHNEA